MEGSRTASNFILVSEQIRPLKLMPGFQKSHRIPTIRRDGLRFLTELSAGEIETDLDQTFSALKNAYHFKRREILASAGERFGIIETPFFRYRVVADFPEDDLSRVIWRRIIDEISEPSQISNPVFLEVFGRQFNSLELLSPQEFPLEKIIDRLEELESELVTLNYDKDLTWCEIGVSPSRIPLRLSGNRLQLSSPFKDASPAELLESMAAIQRNVLELLDTDLGLPKLS